jgi:hypothetical protein
MYIVSADLLTSISDSLCRNFPENNIQPAMLINCGEIFNLYAFITKERSDISYTIEYIIDKSDLCLVNKFAIKKHVLINIKPHIPSSIQSSSSYT